ncbi:RNA polymerase factor sigma-54 [Methylocystis parvus]|uniref:RNA polymerase sigma-54 factor n=1 Tax=Methylocystis parvus TaxID=134 RepID=A0A6B8M001_9HYPH|nr:RNA polymerase factor sigma-54 [Methylocystis parvus]QGM97044.1 RNA polymerase factor sigma-54 [Methylocystis parvus]WBJ99060.1 RNA polymerase factor sigma-54 [Methylocystis parvus OBBP]
MAISTKLMMRQGQALVMTPQLLQAIKLLQFSNLELSAFLHDELERNPLLEAQEGDYAPEGPAGEGAAGNGEDFGPGAASESFDGEPHEGDWARDSLAVDSATLSADLGADMSNAFEPEGPAVTAAAPREALEGAGLSATSWSGAAGGGGDDGEAPNLEAYVAARPSLHEHLGEQLALACSDPRGRLIGQAIIDGIDETGYLRESLEDIAERLGADFVETEAVLAAIQRFDPSGVGARDLAECLAIQLRERDRYDPAMQAFVANLPLVAKRDFVQLAKLCGVDMDDVADMAAELRRLDPKPGRAFGDAPIQPLVADVIVRAAADGSWHVELNSDALPKVLVNHSYAARVSAGARDADKTFISTCLQNANWLTKSLEQRSRTILKVASEIVRLQDAFLAKGVEHLRPLNLRTIADAIGMHESTVSRVTSNKYMATPRGIFELKYFFSASIATTSGGEAHSAESVRFRIKQMIDRETADDVLSDDAIVARLKAIDIDIARRTVAKYRDSLRIPSSVDRRRAKMALAREQAH